MGVIATVAGGLAVLFPETLGRYLNGIFSTPISFHFGHLTSFLLQEAARVYGGGP